MMAQTLKLYETAVRSMATQSTALLIKLWSNWVFLSLSISCIVAEVLINTDTKDAIAELISMHTYLMSHMANNAIMLNYLWDNLELDLSSNIRNYTTRKQRKSCADECKAWGGKERDTNVARSFCFREFRLRIVSSHRGGVESSAQGCSWGQNQLLG